MNSDDIRGKIKQIIGNVAGMDPGRIKDGDHLRSDLNLDSLSLLEIGVDVDLAFQLGLPDERYKQIDSLPGMVELVQERMAEMSSQQQQTQPQQVAVG
jgi:acyl carrier protein